ncbi:hypothetical protein [Pantoea ananatis]|uniref:hypothetical protein n=1 Tax=Pantoea ananas TaxID=553 RepID=UPI0025C7F337|nr:hypothetical protein [Pantoea ananatis]MDN4131893.1 hypothetical protein [Pantoea ananatis]
MKVKLLNDGGFSFLQHLSFPIEIDAKPNPRLDNSILVKSIDLVAVGAGDNCKNLFHWHFADDEFEVVNE